MSTKVSGYVFRGTITKDQLVALVNHRFSALAYAIVRRIDDAVFVGFAPDVAARLVEEWTDGRVFDDACEVRWLKKGEHYAVLLLTEAGSAAAADVPPGFERSGDSPLAVARPSSSDTHGLLLWGTRFVGGHWWEARIPRPLDYPHQTGIGHPILSYYLYSDKSIIKWVRLRGLKEVQQDATV